MTLELDEFNGLNSSFKIILIGFKVMLTKGSMGLKTF